MAGRPKQNLEWRGYVGVTKREKEVLEKLEVWRHASNKANTRNLANEIGTSIEQMAYLLRNLIKKGLVDRTGGCSYCVSFNRPKEIELQEGMTIRTIINRELYDRIETRMQINEKTMREIIEELLTLGFQKYDEIQQEKIRKQINK